jgi:PRTRC genetic system ThiF family protein
MIVHYADKYLLNPQHKITVNLIGVGGTGSIILTRLASLNEALISLGHPGLHVYCYDGDTISAANIGRQMFSPADIGINKAICLVTRINRYFGYEWEAIPEAYTSILQRSKNITISCVDTAAARVSIHYLIKNEEAKTPFDLPKYWLDFGNLMKTGQVVLGTCGNIKQPASTDNMGVSKLRNVVELFPELKKIKEKDQGPSCSLAEAITRQDLFINSSLADLGMNLLWNLFREGMVTCQGLYLNLETMSVNPIKIN